MAAVARLRGVAVLLECSSDSEIEAQHDGWAFPFVFLRTDGQITNVTFHRSTGMLSLTRRPEVLVQYGRGAATDAP